MSFPNLLKQSLFPLTALFVSACTGTQEISPYENPNHPLYKMDRVGWSSDIDRAWLDGPNAPVIVTSLNDENAKLRDISTRIVLTPIVVAATVVAVPNMLFDVVLMKAKDAGFLPF
ncbi:MAG: hypothetical protein IJY80_02045 [Opitutales bacterium]|nr:hypothetical protein [Opitutales bacterium]MBQ9758490.1 hypothetical protein [Opitutales bacterium]